MCRKILFFGALSVEPPPPVDLYVGGAYAHAPNTQNFTLTLPEGIQEGDFVLVLAGCGYDSDRDRVLSPSGYTTIARPNLASGAWKTYNYLGYKFMGPTPDTTLTIAGCAPYPADYAAIAVAHVWRGIDPTHPLDVSPVITTQSGLVSSLVTAGPITPVTPGAIVLAACTVSDGYGYTLTQPAGFENGVQHTYDPSGAYVVSVASKVWSSGEVTQVDWDGFSVPYHALGTSWCGIMLALRPED